MRKQKRTSVEDCLNWVVVSDLHCGCQLGLCHPGGVQLDNGGTYKTSIIQDKIWCLWEQFWIEWVPMATKGKPYGVIINGDAIDGRHHGATSTISNNLSIQRYIAYKILSEIVERSEGRFFLVRGTPVHVGESAEDEEELARDLGAIPNEFGQYSRNELWKRIGRGLCHFTHHIATSSSASYESTGVFKELVENFVEAGRWGLEPPDIVVRSHRHRSMKIEIPTKNGMGISVVSAGWQLKTPFVYKIGARNTQPQIGGLLISQGDEDLYVRTKTWTLDRPQVE
jgi:hypothetical protein